MKLKDFALAAMRRQKFYTSAAVVHAFGFTADISCRRCATMGRWPVYSVDFRTLKNLAMLSAKDTTRFGEELWSGAVRPICPRCRRDSLAVCLLVKVAIKVGPIPK